MTADNVMRHHIAGPITEKLAKKTIAALRELHDADNNAIWDITITSKGGHAESASAIYSELYSHSLWGGGTHHIITTVRGEASSGGALILQAGDDRFMGCMDRILFHEPRLSCDGISLSDAHDFVDEYQRMFNKEVDIYVGRSPMTAEDFKRHVFYRDWVLHYEEALQLGFVDGLG